MADAGQHAVESFIAKWQSVTASELSTSQGFLSDLCILLGVGTPHATRRRTFRRWLLGVQA